MLPHLFCPQCDELIIGAEQCKGCGWRMPVSKQPGEVLTQTTLGHELSPEPKDIRMAARVRSGSKVLICSPTHQHVLIGIDADSGEKLWQNDHALPADSFSIGVIAADGLFWCAANFTQHVVRASPATLPIVALDPNTGKVVWQYDISTNGLSVPAVKDGRVLVIDSHAKVWCINIADKQVLWQTESVGTWSLQPPALGMMLHDGHRVPVLAIPARQDCISLVQAQHGTLLAQYDLNREKEAVAWFQHTPLFHDHLLIASNSNRSLYAFDLNTQTQHWQYPPLSASKYAKLREFTTPPMYHKGQVFVGVKDYSPTQKDNKGRPASAYAVHVIDAATGTLGQRIEIANTPSHTSERAYVTTPLSVCPAGQAAQPDLLLVGNTQYEHLPSDDETPKTQFETDARHELRAIDLATWRELWRVRLPSAAITAPIAHQHHLVVLTRAGQSLQVCYRPSLPTSLFDGADYEAKKAYDLAALAYGLQGKWANAAQVYTKLQQSKHAAVCYEQANDVLSAARVYVAIYREATGRNPADAQAAWANAVRLLTAAQAWSELGELYADASKFAEAAQAFVKAGAWAQAAEYFERVKQWAEAATCYEKAEAWSRALTCWEALPVQQLPSPITPTYLAKLCVNAKQWPKAAQYFEQSTAFEDAGTAYSEAKDLVNALRCWYCAFVQAKTLLNPASRLSIISRCAEAIHHLNRQLEPVERFDLAQAEAFYTDVRAALGRQPEILLDQWTENTAEFWYGRAMRLSANQPPNEAAAQAYEKAKVNYEFIANLPMVKQCEDWRYFHRRLPNFMVESVTGAFIQDTIESWNVAIKNVGYQAARKVWVEPQSTFIKIESRIKPQTVAKLSPNEVATFKVTVKMPSHLGAFEVALEVNWIDIHGQIYTHVTQAVQVTIKPAHPDGPIKIEIHGDFVYGKKGDEVNISHGNRSQPVRHGDNLLTQPDAQPNEHAQG
ncbi:MAG: PQQ-binding-like beta-propeller repeat protein [Anaerolineae bacterium]|nr:PQQ-binding-like beta-propeller repeat protein [Anaerolineae bacterium]